jgi:hypothetical protein
MQVKLDSIVCNALMIGSCIIEFQQFVNLWSITLTLRVRLVKCVAKTCTNCMTLEISVADC